MAMAVRYTTINGRIVSEDRGGTRRYYASDALGSTVALYDESATKTDSFKYWPYGETRTSSGSSPTKYKFVGTLGCREQADGGIYMRARIEDPEDGRWMTVDPLWPYEAAYAYASVSPTTFIDPSGMKTCRESLFDILKKLHIKPGSISSILRCLVQCEEGSFWKDWRVCVLKCLTKLGKTNLIDLLAEYACCETYGNKGNDPCVFGKFYDKNKCCDIKWCVCMTKSPGGGLGCVPRLVEIALDGCVVFMLAGVRLPGSPPWGVGRGCPTR